MGREAARTVRQRLRLRLLLSINTEQKIENILALRGDRTADREPAGDFRYAADLVEFIKNHGDFNIIGACYPEGHQESGGLVRDMKHLKDKVDAGVSQREASTKVHLHDGAVRG